MKEKITYKTYLVFLGAAVLALVPFFKVCPGIDFTDTGYSIVNFVNFTDSRSTWSLSTYLANFLGFIFVNLPGGHTLTGIRAYCTPVVSATALVSFLGLGRYFNRAAVFAGVLVAELMTWCPYVVLYNYLSYLLLAVIVVLIMKALTGPKHTLLTVAGVLLGLNVFTRISNLTEAILIAPVVVYGIWNKDKAQEILKAVWKCIGGFLIGGACAFAMTVITHGFSGVRDSLASIFMLTDAEYGYSMSDMLLAIPNEMVYYAKWLGLLLIPGIMAVVSGKLWGENRGRKAASLVTGAISFTALLVVIRYMAYWAVFTIHEYDNHISVRVFVLIWFLLAVVLGIKAVVMAKINKVYGLQGIILLCLAFIAPLGTNTGLLSIQNNLFLIMPMCLGLLVEDTSFKKDMLGPKSAVIALSGVMLMLTLYQGGRFYTTYVYGSAPRQELTASMETGVLKGAKTLPGMVGILEELEEYVGNNISRDDKVITWGDIPLISYELNMNTAFSTGWPDLVSFNYETFSRELNSLENCPVIITNNWYSGGDPTDPLVRELNPKADLLAAYMETNAYERVWSNDKFTIYTSK